MAKAKQTIPDFKYKLTFLLGLVPSKTKFEILRKIKENGVSDWNLRKIRETFSYQTWNADYNDLKVIVGVLGSYNNIFKDRIGISISSAEDLENVKKLISKKVPKRKIA